MKTKGELSKEAKQLRLNKSTSHWDSVVQIAQYHVHPLPLPPCFGILYYNDKRCRLCVAAEYCEYLSKFHPKLPESAVCLEETDTTPMNHEMFKDGSRAAIFVQRWNGRWLTRKQLDKLSRELFEGTIIDIDRIFTALRKRRVLQQAAKTFSVKSPDLPIKKYYRAAPYNYEEALATALRDLYERQHIPPGKQPSSPLDFDASESVHSGSE